MTGALFDMMNEVRHALMRVVMTDAVEIHFLVAARTHDAVAADDALRPFVKNGVALRAAHPDFQQLDGIGHDTAFR